MNDSIVIGITLLNGCATVKNRQHVIYVLLIIVLIGVLSFALNNYRSTKQFISNSVERETNELLSNFVTEVDRFSSERLAEVELIADYLSYLIEDGANVQDFLQQQLEKLSYYAGFGFIKPNGEIFTADGHSFVVSQKDTFQRALAGEVVFSDVFELHQDPSQKVIAISVPVMDKTNTVIGVLSTVVNMSTIISSVADESNLPGTIFLLKNEELLFSSSPASIIEKELNLIEKNAPYIYSDTAGTIMIDSNSAHFMLFKHAWNGFVVIVDSVTNDDRKNIAQSYWNNLFLVIATIVLVVWALFYAIQLEKSEISQARRDLLTKLDNRLALELHLQKKIDSQPGKTFVLYFISLDRFREVNERFGFQTGDQIIYSISRLIKTLPGKIGVYRVGNEEFVLTTNESSIEGQKEYAEKIVRLLEQPLKLGNEGFVWLTASVGIRASSAADTVAKMMQDGIFASQEASKQGGNQAVYFCSKLAAASEQHRLLSHHLANAFSNGEFYLLFQPIYHIQTNKIVSFETLLRWKSPALGEIGPAQFIPLLEENDAIVKVGRWIIHQVAEQVKQWEVEGYTDFTVTINISVRQLQYSDFLQDIQRILHETKVNPNRIVFELTESIVAQNIDAAANILSTLNSWGIKTALDDFGTGYSSLSILKMLPFQIMKVDRAFVQEVESDGGESKAVLKGIIAIAKGLGLTTVMEGVETLEQLQLLQVMGADRIQGYYISKPLQQENAIAMLHSKQFLESNQ